MKNDKPSIVLVHGFWGDAAHWSRVILDLSKRGYTDVRAVENPLTSLTDDAERTRKMVAGIEGPVVLAGHSYGGAVITQAGDLPNVAALVYVAAFAPDVGESAGSLSQSQPPDAFGNIVPDTDGYLWVRRDAFHDSFCHDMGADDALVMACTQKAPLAAAFTEAATRAAWRNKPSWYQLSTRDRMIHPALQERMSARLGAQRVLTLDASHASLASRPADIAGLIDEAAAATAR